MIFFLVSFSAAALAAMGVQALLQLDDAVRRRRLIWLAGGLGVLTLLAVAGGFQPIMKAIADPQRFGGVITNYPNFRIDAVRVLLFGLLAAGLLWRRFPQATWGLALGGLVLLDLWTVERQFIQWTPPASQSFAADGVVQAVQGDSTIFRGPAVRRVRREPQLPHDPPDPVRARLQRPGARTGTTSSSAARTNGRTSGARASGGCWP